MTSEQRTILSLPGGGGGGGLLSFRTGRRLGIQSVCRFMADSCRPLSRRGREPDQITAAHSHLGPRVRVKTTIGNVPHSGDETRRSRKYDLPFWKVYNTLHHPLRFAVSLHHFTVNSRQKQNTSRSLSLDTFHESQISCILGKFWVMRCATCIFVFPTIFAFKSKER